MLHGWKSRRQDTFKDVTTPEMWNFNGHQSVLCCWEVCRRQHGGLLKAGGSWSLGFHRFQNNNEISDLVCIVLLIQPLWEHAGNLIRVISVSVCLFTHAANIRRASIPYFPPLNCWLINSSHLRTVAVGWKTLYGNFLPVSPISQHFVWIFSEGSVWVNWCCLQRTAPDSFIKACQSQGSRGIGRKPNYMLHEYIFALFLCFRKIQLELAM